MRSPARPLVVSLVVLAGCPRGSETTEVPEPIAISTTIPEADTPSEPRAPEGPLRYRGQVVLPVGDPIALFVELLPADEGWQGTLTIPQQFLYDVALGGVVVAPGQLAFELERAGARFEGALAEDGEVDECSFSQGGATLECTLEPITEEALAAVRNPPRPQTPQPPFPYDVLEVEYDNVVDHVHLAGTLTIPPGPGPHPAALLITGSGAQDRDETIAGHKPFWVLADHLTRQGIAVLRVDDRGVGGSTGTLSESNGAALTRDVAVGIELLREHERIDPARVGVVGHSEGGLVGPRAASLDPKIAFVVMMAGPGVPGHEVIREQAAAMLEANGSPETTIEIVRNRQAQALAIVTSNVDDEEARAQLEPIMGPQADGMLSPWFRDFARYDPRPALEKVRCPVLVLNGELDLQVLPDQNLPAIEEALRRNRKRTTVHRLPGLNHLFQPAKTGLPGEYASIEQTIDPQVLEIIGEWIVDQTKARPGKRR